MRYDGQRCIFKIERWLLCKILAFSIFHKFLLYGVAFKCRKSNVLTWHNGWQDKSSEEADANIDEVVDEEKDEL